MNLRALAISVGVCVVLAVAGNAWAGDGLTSWYPRLIKPRRQVPLWGFVAVGATVYVLEGAVLYRLLVHVDDRANRAVAMTALLAVMICNEAWNYIFFGMRDLRVALATMIGYLAPLTILMTALFAYDSTSGWLLAPYCAWVAYDVWWIRELARLNPPQKAPGAAADQEQIP
jgi:translocator protein